MSAKYVDKRSRKGNNKSKLPRKLCPHFLDELDYSNTWAGVSAIHNKTQQPQCLDLTKLLHLKELGKISDKVIFEVGAFLYAVEYDWLPALWHKARESSQKKKRLAQLMQGLQNNLIRYLNWKGLWNPLLEFFVGAYNAACNQAVFLNAPLRGCHLLLWCALPWSRANEQWCSAIFECIRKHVFDEQLFHIVGGMTKDNVCVYLRAAWRICNKFLLCQGMDPHYNFKQDNLLPALVIRGINLLADTQTNHGEIVKKYTTVEQKVIAMTSHSRSIHTCCREMLELGERSRWSLCMNDVTDMYADHVWYLCNLYGYDGFLGCQLSIKVTKDHKVIPSWQTHTVSLPIPLKDRPTKISIQPWLDSRLGSTSNETFIKALKALVGSFNDDSVDKFGDMMQNELSSNLSSIVGVPMNVWEPLIWDWLEPQAQLVVAGIFCVMNHCCNVAQDGNVIVHVCVGCATWQLGFMSYFVLNKKICENILDTKFQWINITVFRWLQDFIIMALCEDRRSVKEMDSGDDPQGIPMDWWLLVSCFKHFEMYLAGGVDFGLKLAALIHCMYLYGPACNYYASELRGKQVSQRLERILSTPAMEKWKDEFGAIDLGLPAISLHYPCTVCFCCRFAERSAK